MLREKEVYGLFQKHFGDIVYNGEKLETSQCPQKEIFKNEICWDFPGGPVLKNTPSNAGDAGSIPDWELRSHVPQGN